MLYVQVWDHTQGGMLTHTEASGGRWVRCWNAMGKWLSKSDMFKLTQKDEHNEGQEMGWWTRI